MPTPLHPPQLGFSSNLYFPPISLLYDFSGFDFAEYSIPRRSVGGSCCPGCPSPRPRRSPKHADMGLTCVVLCLFVCFLPLGRGPMPPFLLLSYAEQIFWEEAQDEQSPPCSPWAICSSHFCFYLQKVFKFQSHHFFSQRKYDEMVFALTGDSKIWWTTIPYGISLPLPSTSTIKEGNTREFFSASLVVVTESMMNVTWAVFTIPKLPSWLFWL